MRGRDIWDWLALLDGCCDVKVGSERQPDGRGGQVTVWTATVAHRALILPTIEVRAASMLEALVAALEEAQSRSWIA